MILGMGCDIVDNRRFKRWLKAYKKPFLSKFLHPVEIKALDLENSVIHVAGIFAVKEAVIKAVSRIASQPVGYLNVRIKTFPGKMPQVKLVRTRIKKYQSIKFHVSVSHEKQFSMATVICENS